MPTRRVQVAAGFDVLGSADREFPVYSAPAQFTGEADAVIDFSSPAALEGLLEFGKRTKTPSDSGHHRLYPGAGGTDRGRRPGRCPIFPLRQHVPGYQCAAGAGEEGGQRAGGQL